MSSALPESLLERLAVLEDAQRLLALQSEVLEAIARSASCDDTLVLLRELIEELVPESMASIMLLDEAGALQFAGTAGMPDQICAAFDGLVPGPAAASCGTAAFTGEPVIVEDTRTDPRWSDFQELVERFGIGSCWSLPVVDAEGSVVATFAISRSVAGKPTPWQLELLGTAGHLAGITIERARERVERERANEQMQHVQRLESLGVLAGGMAHDFNNLLTAVIGNASLAMETGNADRVTQRALDNIDRAAKRAAALCSQMLAYAGRADVSFESCDLNAIAREIGELFESTVANRAELVFELDEGVAVATADSGQIGQVVLNLINNAADAIDRRNEHGRIVVRTGALDSPPPSSEFEFGEPIAGRRCVFVEIEDDGCGMPREALKRVFDPFYTTKPAGRGLGLAAVLGIVRAHGGAIRVRSAPDQGTCMCVLLPASRVRPSGVAGVADDRCELRGRVLVVDDDSSVRDVVRTVLRQAGAEVIIAHGGIDALERIGALEPEFDAVLLDLTMPDLPGEQVLDALQRAGADARIVVTSGDGEAQARARIGERRFHSFLQKPFTSAELRRAVGDALERFAG